MTGTFSKALRPTSWNAASVTKPAEGGLASAVWFAMHAKGCEADYVCTPAPIHNPDGSESLWCYTRPSELYGTLRDALGHFPLQHFWGPMANVKSTAWIVESAIVGAKQWRPNFFYIYLPHLDYEAQRSGPGSPAATQAVKNPPPMPVWKLFRTRFVLSFTISKIFLDPVWYFYIFWFPDYLRHARGFDMAAIGRYAWIPFFVAGAGNLAGGWLAASLLRRGVPLSAARKEIDKQLRLSRQYSGRRPHGMDRHRRDQYA